MNWDALVDFLKAENPAFAASLQGASSQDVLRLEENFDIHLPSTYREFLLTMGRDSGGFYLFGPSQNHKFDDLVAQLPADSYPGERYFKIAFPQDDSDISPSDYFLDLTRSDGEDAPIVTFEDMGQFRSEYVTEMGFNFGEWVTHSLFTFLVLDHLRERSTVVIANLSSAEGSESKNEVIALAERMHFELALPPLEHVVCFRRGNLGALVEVLMGGRSIALTLGSDDGGALEVVVDQLLLRFPHALISRRGGPFAG